MKSIFISVPMSGRSDEDIFYDISQRILEYDKEEGITFVDNLFVPNDVHREAMKSKKPASKYIPSVSTISCDARFTRAKGPTRKTRHSSPVHWTEWNGSARH